MIRSRSLFASFFLGGFECSSFRTREGERRDLLAETGHDRQAAADFRQLHGLGIRTVRSGIRWHRVEREPGVYDFSAELPVVQAARETRTQVIWDLFHYGWPDFLEVFSPAFVEHFAGLARAFALLLARESRGPVMLSPVNEISFLAWAGGDEGVFNPFAVGRGDELKRQLVRAFIAATQAVWEVLPQARIVSPEPVIHIAPAPERPWDAPAAEAYRRSMFQAWDMIAGRLCPELGGHERFLDVLGLNFYPANQWIHVEKGEALRPLRPGDALYRPFREILGEVYRRYRRPLFVAETGAEGEARAPWLAYVAGEVQAAIQAGIPVEGICLYPVTDYPAWDDKRCCRAGLLGYPSPQGRPVYRPLAEELARWQERLEGATAPG
ncbi:MULTISPECIES: beta-glucosidase [unclassified Meiothermus]|uniref:beta-glucosidase n=1 Tax=unclassified Meiothermus TaxID=370471 RepID=UPI00157F8A09|nr:MULTISPECIES: beta-glucosidase [unclassified Meiothermus]